MKKTLLLAAALVATAMGAFAQGTVQFINNASTLVSFQAGGAVPAGYNIGLWYGVEGTADENALALIASTTTAAPGRFVGGNVTTPDTTAGGGMAVFQIRAWESGFASYAAAFSGGGNVGSSDLWTQITGNATPTDLPKQIVPPTGGFTGIDNVAIVPEPSTIALGLLGLGALALFRRRK
jgi:hypothetical protein